MSTAYVDASALVKLVIEEPESQALAAHLERYAAVVSSIVGRIELGRAARRFAGGSDTELLGRVEKVLAGVIVIPLDVAIAAAAATVAPPNLRTLDAVHLATIMAVESELDCCFCYDGRLAEAVAARGITVSAPAE